MPKTRKGDLGATGSTTMTPEQLKKAMGIPFSDEQMEAICSGASHLGGLEPEVIVAAAGTGKTTVMAARVVWLVGNRLVEPNEVLGLTFTVKATNELAHRIEKALTDSGLISADEVDLPTVQTYDSFAGLIVQQYELLLGQSTASRIINQAEALQLAMLILKRIDKPLPTLGTYSDLSLAKNIVQLDGEMSANGVTPNQLRSFDESFEAALQAQPINPRTAEHPGKVKMAIQASEKRQELLSLVEKFRVEKQQRGLISFADQTELAVKLVKQFPPIGEDLRNTYRVVLLDEYQDTSSAQAEILKNVFSAEGVGYPVTAVGDPHQAIYGWRGAAANNIAQFPFLFTNKDGTAASKHSLHINRRSGQKILNLANEVIDPGDKDQNSAEPKESVNKETKERLLVAPKGAEEGKVFTASFETWEAERRWLTDQIIEESDLLLEEKPEENWKEIAVLCRNNSTVSEVFQALTLREVPVEIVGLGGLLELPEISQIVSTLKILADPMSNTDTAALLTSPRWGIAPADLNKIASQARKLANPELAQQRLAEGEIVDAGKRRTKSGSNSQVSSQLGSLLEAVANPPFLRKEVSNQLVRFSKELEYLRRYLNDSIAALVAKVIEVQGIESELLATGAPGRARLRQLDRFVEVVSDYQGIGQKTALVEQPSLTEFLAYLDLEISEGTGLELDNPSQDNSVKLLTVHRAKGLEWDVVFLPNLVEGVFPSNRSEPNFTKSYAVLPASLRRDSSGIPQLSEPSQKGLGGYEIALKDAGRKGEDRLAYVAITRARKKLFVSSHLWKEGAKRQKTPSSYFEEAESQARVAGTIIRRVNPDSPAPDTPQIKFDWPIQLDQSKLEALQSSANQVLDYMATREPVVSENLDEEHLMASWNSRVEAVISRIRSERRATQIELPNSMSVSQVVRLKQDSEKFRQNLQRPMPTRPNRQANVGSAFHNWVEQHYRQQGFLDYLDEDRDLPLVTKSDRTRLKKLIARFKSSDFANKTPFMIEVPFIYLIGDKQLRGRIDAVFAFGDDPNRKYQIIDWKTFNSPADPTQLSIYRLAWAAYTGCELSNVEAGYYYVESGRYEPLAHYLTQDELAQLLVN